MTIANTTFSRHHYDARGDALYLSAEGYVGPPAKASSTPEGHNIEYDEDGRVIGMTLTNVRRLLDQRGDVALSALLGQISAEQLAPVLPQRA